MTFYNIFLLKGMFYILNAEVNISFFLFFWVVYSYAMVCVVGILEVVLTARGF